MLTGTPLDLTPFGVILDAISIGYWLLAAAGIVLALKAGGNWKERIAGIAVVALLFGIVPGVC